VIPDFQKNMIERKKIQDKIRKLSKLTGKSDTFPTGPFPTGPFTINQQNHPDDQITSEIEITISAVPKQESDDKESTEYSFSKLQNLFTSKKKCNVKKIWMSLMPSFIEIMIFILLLVIWDIHFFTTWR